MKAPAPRGIGRVFADRAGRTAPFDVAVVVPTIGRPELGRALRSVFAQDFPGSVQILVGYDLNADRAEIDAIAAERPDRMSVLSLELPYSTARHNGGFHNARCGAMRAILTFAAHARHVAYLDDDNLMLPSHLRLMAEAVRNRFWAFGRRILVDGETGLDIAVDQWLSTGPGGGTMVMTGGFVDTGCLIVDKMMLAREIGLWASAIGGWAGRDTEDRNFYQGIVHYPHGAVGEATVRYSLRRARTALWLHIAEAARQPLETLWQNLDARAAQGRAAAAGA